MSVLLDILRCVLCCVEDKRDEDHYEPLHRNTTWETGVISSGLIINSGTSYSPNFESTFANPGERFHDVIASLKQSIKHEPVTNYHLSGSTSRIPQSPSNPSPSKPKPQTSYNQIHSSVVPTTTCAKPSAVSPTTTCAKPSAASPTTTYAKPSAASPTTTCAKPSAVSPTTCAKPSAVSPTCPPSSSKPSPQAASQSLNPSLSIQPSAASQSLNPLVSVPKPLACHSKTSSSFPTPLASYSKPAPISPIASQSSLETSSSASKAPSSFKPTLSSAFSNSNDQQMKANYIWVQKNESPIYAIPGNIQDLIKRDKVPEVLKKPLSLSTYKDYFAALLYAEDFYIEKWSEFKLVNVTLKLQQATIFKRSYLAERYKKENKTFVAFEIDASREKRPFLLSRDFVFVRPTGTNAEPFQGIIYRVERSTNVLVEFGGDFHAQHYLSRKYDVSFSFNRVCLKRAHQAIEAASDPLFKSFTFPDREFKRIISPPSPFHGNHKLDMDQTFAVSRILTLQGPPPYLIEGPLCFIKDKKKGYESKELSITGLVVQQAVLEIYRSLRTSHVLICAPINSTCDDMMRSLKEIPESEMFRANAAFREIDGVSTDILASSLYKNECFVCPPLHKLKKFRVILSTYVSSFRLHNEGICAGHFSHIFMVDASSATEPEVMVALANLANGNTAVVVTGAPRNHSGWVRSDLARENGLRISYFERLRQRNRYKSLDPLFITRLAESDSKSDDTASFMSSLYM